MSKAQMPVFRRTFVAILERRLNEPRRFLQVVAGARQVGKTTSVRQALEDRGGKSFFASADEPELKDRAWISAQWERARLATNDATAQPVVLALDEIQKIPAWSETVKRLWDEDTRNGVELRVVLLGSAPLLVRQGLNESLAGRFELLRLPHWSLAEMQEAFGLTLEEYVFFGGYPGAAPLVSEPARWRRYLLDSLIETTISRDVLLMTRVHKPALLRQLFQLGCLHSGQILSFTKMLGQLQDAGNTTTLAHYLELLSGAGMLMGMQNFTRRLVRGRSSSPKLQVLNTALMTAIANRELGEARQDAEYWGRLVESAVGAHLANAAACGECELYYWRKRNREVDFVIARGTNVVAIEVKSGRKPLTLPGLEAFQEEFDPTRTLLVGADGIPLQEFLAKPVQNWLQ